MPHPTRIIGHVAGWAEEHARHVRELGEREVNQQHADQGKVYEEQGVDAFGRDGRKTHQSHDENLDLGDFGLVEVAQAEARAHDAEQQPEREIIIEQGHVAQAVVEEPPPQQKEQGRERQTAGQ